MIFDTGSCWLWIDGSECTNCPDLPRFDYKASSSFEHISSGKSLYYGTGSVHGIVGADSICLKEEICAKSFNFVVV